MALITIGSGQTTAGDTAWQAYAAGEGQGPNVEGQGPNVEGQGLYVDVNTSSAGFSATPLYFTSLGGNRDHWATTGATSIYQPTPTGFRVYVRWWDGRPFTPEEANSAQWHINWLGIQP